MTQQMTVTKFYRGPHHMQMVIKSYEKAAVHFEQIGNQKEADANRAQIAKMLEMYNGSVVFFCG